MNSLIFATAFTKINIIILLHKKFLVQYNNVGCLFCFIFVIRMILLLKLFIYRWSQNLACVLMASNERLGNWASHFHLIIVLWICALLLRVCAYDFVTWLRLGFEYRSILHVFQVLQIILKSELFYFFVLSYVL